MHGATINPGRGEGDDQDGDASGAGPACAHSSGDVVCPDTVGDPFLGTVDDVDVAMADSRGFDIGNVGAGCVISAHCNQIYIYIWREEGRENSKLTIRFSNPKTKRDAPIRYTRQESLFLLRSAEVRDRRHADAVPAPESPIHTCIPLYIRPSALCPPQSMKYCNRAGQNLQLGISHHSQSVCGRYPTP